MKVEDFLGNVDADTQVRIMQINSLEELDGIGVKYVNKVLYKGRIRGMCWQEWEKIRGKTVAKVYNDWDPFVPCVIVLNIILRGRNAVKDEHEKTSKDTDNCKNQTIHP